MTNLNFDKDFLAELSIYAKRRGFTNGNETEMLEIVKSFISDNFDRWGEYAKETEQLKDLVVEPQATIENDEEIDADEYLSTLNGLNLNPKKEDSKEDKPVIDDIEDDLKHEEDTSLENDEEVKDEKSVSDSKKKLKANKKHKLSKKSIIKIVLSAALAGSIVFGAGVIIDKVKREQDAAAATSFYETTQFENVDDIKLDAENLEEEPEIKGPDFDELEAKYPGVVGYLQGGVFKEAFPVMPGNITDTNTKYLNHLPDGTPSTVGSVCFNDDNDPNLTEDVSILFAHNISDNRLFGAVNLYKDEANITEPLYYFTRNGCYELEPFAYTNVNDLTYGNMSDAQKEQIVNDAKNDSLIHPNVEIGPDDRIMVAFTCLDMSDPNYSFKPDKRQTVWFKVNPVYENIKSQENSYQKS